VKSVATDAAGELSVRALADAFPAMDASEEEVLRMAEVAPDARLEAAVPLMSPADEGELEEAVAGTRVVYLRDGAAIPLVAILAIGGSIILHSLIVGVAVLAFFWTFQRGNGEGNLPGAEGGSGRGYMISGEGELGEPVVGGGLKELLPETSAMGQSMPTLPEFSERVDVEQVAAAGVDPLPGVDAMIGVPTGGTRTGSVKPPSRVVRKEPVAPAPQVAVAPPSPRADVTGGPVAVAGPKTGATSSPRGGKGFGGGDENEGEEIIPLSKEDAAGMGRGKRAGGGLDRGGSGANNPEPMILELPAIEYPAAMRITPPAQSTKVKVTVLANGRASGVELVQSCGQPDLDALCTNALLKAKYWPAYRAGKPYEAVMSFEQKYRR
jgi:hypothetical protein